MVDLLVNGVEPTRMLSAINEVTRSAEVVDWLKMSFHSAANTVVELVSNSRAACANSRIRECVAAAVCRAKSTLSQLPWRRS